VNKKLCRLGHICIVVEDINRSIEFYRDLLGLKFIKYFVCEGDTVDKILGINNCKQIIAQLGENNNCLIELIEFDHPKGRKDSIIINENDIGIRHICFIVNDIFDVYKELSEKGIKFTSEPIKTESGQIYVFLRDPDNNSIEFMQEV